MGLVRGERGQGNTCTVRTEEGRTIVRRFGTHAGAGVATANTRIARLMSAWHQPYDNRQRTGHVHVRVASSV